jgi:hypothetical protein
MILRHSIEPEPEKTQLQNFSTAWQPAIGNLLTWCRLQEEKALSTFTRKSRVILLLRYSGTMSIFVMGERISSAGKQLKG